MTSKPILIIQLRPEDLTSDDEYQSILKYAGLSVQQTQRLRAEQSGLPEIDLNCYSAIIVGGSPFDVTTPEAQKSAIQKQIELGFNQLFEQVVARDFPFLGACSGNGLLGSYLGVSMSGQYAEPVCCRTVSLTQAAKNDPLLVDFPERFDVLLGHKEACDEVPHGATLLVQGEQCPVQMFRVKNNIYATQFHPEGDYEGFKLRIEVYKNHGYFDPDRAAKILNDLESVSTPFAHKILSRFAQRYCD